MVGEIDSTKTRRKIEDVLRKSDTETLIRVASILGVEVVELPSIPELEKRLADILQLPAGMTGKIPGSLHHLLLNILPVRFEVYFVCFGNLHKWERQTRDYFTSEEAKNHLSGQNYFVNKRSLNILGMRTAILTTKELVRKGDSEMSPAEQKVMRQIESLIRT